MPVFVKAYRTKSGKSVRSYLRTWNAMAANRATANSNRAKKIGNVIAKKRLIGEIIFNRSDVRYTNANRGPNQKRKRSTNHLW